MPARSRSFAVAGMGATGCSSAGDGTPGGNDGGASAGTGGTGGTGGAAGAGGAAGSGGTGGAAGSGGTAGSGGATDAGTDAPPPGLTDAELNRDVGRGVHWGVWVAGGIVAVLLLLAIFGLGGESAPPAH